MPKTRSAAPRTPSHSLPPRAAFLLLVPDEASAAAIAAATPGAVHLPGWDVPPLSGRPPSKGAEARRLEAVARIDKASRPRIVASVGAALEALPPADLAARTVTIEVRAPFEPLADRLRALGLVEVTRADRPGTFATYGATLDLWPASEDRPFRARTEAGKVSAIEPFDPHTMRTDGGTVPRLDVGQHAANPDPDGKEGTDGEGDPHAWPVRWPRRTLRDLLGKARVLAAEGVEEAARVMLAAIDEEHAERLAAGGHLPPRGACLCAEELAALLAEARPFTSGEVEGSRTVPAPARALSSELLATGDLVVHLHHGIGAFRGVETIEVDGNARDVLRIAFADGTLAVPACEAGLVWRYGEREGEGRALDRMGAADWTEGMAEMLDELRRTAEALLDRRKRLDATSAPRIDWDGPLLRACASDWHEPTADQRRALEEIAADMGGAPEGDTGRHGATVRPPMDRLLCGDTGFGKTEIILRAALATLESGRQSLVAVPTVLLASQHVDTMTRRLSPLGIAVHRLDGTVSEADRRETLAVLERGEPAIVVGTHLLASDTVRPAALGLLVFDEEQRFGTDVKMSLREKGEDAHVLATTATPIPRTMLGALVGLRSVSTLGAAPPGRRGGRTEAHDWDEPLLRRAFEREARAGGRSFVVVPQVADMDPVAEGLASLMPEARIARLHGRMADDEAMAALEGFRGGRFDILLATSVIETGLDVPEAGLMVVLDAGRFGLSQLHQLRGRVGRGTRPGRTLLLADCAWTGREKASAAAWSRLDLLELHDGPGAGFAIAEHDRENRGGGELFGEEQSGHAERLGLELSTRLLRDALDGTLDLGAFGASTSVVLPGARLPADSIPQGDVRARLYARLARARDAEEIEALAREIADRFGPPPEPARAFLTAARLAARARALGVRGIVAGPEAVALELAPERADVLRRVVGGGTVSWKGDRMIVRSSKTEPARTRAVLDALERADGTEGNRDEAA